MKARKNKKKTAAAVAPESTVSSTPPTPPQTGDRSPLTALDGWLIVGLTVLALIMRLWRIERPCFWGDEIHTFLRSLPSIPMIFKTEWTDPSQFPPLHYVITHLGIKWFGAHEVGARLPNIILAAGTVPLQYLIARMLVGRRLAWISTLAMAVSLFHVYYSRDIHSYGLLGFFAALSFYLFLRLILWSPQPWFCWAGYALSTTAMMLTHYLGGVACMIQALIGGYFMIVVMGMREKRWRDVGRLIARFALALVVVVAGMAPYLGSLLNVSGQASGTADTIHFTRVFFNETLGWLGLGTGWWLLLYAAILLLGAVGLFWRRRPCAYLVFFWLLFPFILFGAVKVGWFYHVRRFIFTLPALMIVFAAGLEMLVILSRRWIANRWLAYLPLVVVVALWCVRTVPAFKDFYAMTSSDLTCYRPAADWMRENLPENTLVMAENYYDLRWVGPGFYHVPNRVYGFAAIFDRPQDYTFLNMHQRFQNFLTKYPEAAFLYTSIWANQMGGQWQWPRTHFRRSQGFENTGGESLAYKGMFQNGSFIDFADTNRLPTWVLFYNTEEDLVAMARAQGQKVLRRLNGGFSFIMTRDLHSWLAVNQTGTIVIHQLDSSPRNVQLKVSAVSLVDGRMEVIGRQGAVVATWPLVKGQMRNYEAVVKDLPPGKYDLRLNLVSQTVSSDNQPACVLFDAITVQ